MKITPENYAEIVSAFSKEEKLRFYEALAHLLTVGCRAIWLNDHLSKDEMIDAMKWLNEIQHRVTAKIGVERRETHEWKEADFISMMSDYARYHPIVGTQVAYAIEQSYAIIEAIRRTPPELDKS